MSDWSLKILSANYNAGSKWRLQYNVKKELKKMKKLGLGIVVGAVAFFAAGSVLCTIF